MQTSIRNASLKKGPFTPEEVSIATHLACTRPRTVLSPLTMGPALKIVLTAPIYLCMVCCRMLLLWKCTRAGLRARWAYGSPSEKSWGAPQTSAVRDGITYCQSDELTTGLDALVVWHSPYLCVRIDYLCVVN